MLHTRQKSERHTLSECFDISVILQLTVEIHQLRQDSSTLESLATLQP